MQLIKLITPRFIISRFNKNGGFKQDEECNQQQEQIGTRFHYFTELSDEIKMYIISFIAQDSLQDLFSFCRTSQSMCSFVQERSLWYHLLVSYGFKTTSYIKDNDDLNLKTYFFDLQRLTSKNSFQFSPLDFTGASPTKRYKHTSSVYKNYLVLIGGQRSNAKRYGDIIYYDTITKSFFRPLIKGDQPPRFSRHTARTIKDKVYIYGGYNGNGTYYNLATFNLKQKKWKNVAQNKLKGDLPEPRSNHCSAVIGTNYYIFSGNNTSPNGDYNILDDFYVLDTTTLTWTRIEAQGDLPAARGGHSMETIDGKLYLFGGGVWHPESDWTVRFNDVHIYDPATNYWTRPNLSLDQFGALPNTSTFTTSFVYGRFLILFGGGCQSVNSVCNSMYALDTHSMSWINLSNYENYDPKPRDMATASIIDNQVYLFGGYCGGPSASFEKITFNFKPLLG